MKDPLDPLLNSRSLADLRAALAPHSAPLSLPQIRRLQAHASSLERPDRDVRLGIVHTYTSSLLDPWLELAAAVQGVRIDTYHAPYGLALQEAQPDSGLVRHRPDVTLLLLQREDLHPALMEPLVGRDPKTQEALRGQVVQRLGGILSQFRGQPLGRIVVTLLPSLHGPALGQYDAQSERSEAAWWSRFKSDLGELCRTAVDATLFLDLDEMLLDLGRGGFFDARFWYTSRYPFAPAAARSLAQRVVDIGVSLKLPKAKVIVLDADNTLWGGVIGEDGFTGIALGPEYPGNLYVAFQRRLLDYQQRGFILALCSKNNPDDLQQVLDEHPHQLIKDEHLAARRVNWVAKPDNLKALAEELNLGLDSFIFVDDSDHECAVVRYQLPQVEVVQTPRKPLLVPGCLEQVARLQVLSVTDEDRSKTQLYAQERSRGELRESLHADGGSVTDYLRSLSMRMQVGIDDASQLQRLAQLTQKTNQFNLTTRRYDEREIREFLDARDCLVAHFSLADTFGDSGVVGLAVWRLPEPDQAQLDTFLMSCRVIGREAESAFLHALLRVLSQRGVHHVVADYLPTPKNALVKDFLPQQGFVIGEDGRYRRDLQAAPAEPADAFPVAVTLNSGTMDNTG